jgi:hypothetical protein
VLADMPDRIAEIIDIGFYQEGWIKMADPIFAQNVAIARRTVLTLVE